LNVFDFRYLIGFFWFVHFAQQICPNPATIILSICLISLANAQHLPAIRAGCKVWSLSQFAGFCSAMPDAAERDTPPSDVLLVFTKYPAPGFAKTRLIPVLGADGAAHVSRVLTARVARAVRDYAAASGVTVVFCVATPAWSPAEDDKAPATASGPDVAAWLQVRGHERVVGQYGADLGERISRAFRDAFESESNQRPRRVVVIGTDIPGIDPQVLECAFSALALADVVVGPALDGGYYLLGMNAFYPQLFENITWSTAKVFAETIQQAELLNLSCTTLNVLRDIDSPADLLHYYSACEETESTE
jgi:uncharacterized protein